MKMPAMLRRRPEPPDHPRDGEAARTLTERCEYRLIRQPQRFKTSHFARPPANIDCCIIMASEGEIRPVRAEQPVMSARRHFWLAKRWRGYSIMKR